MPPERPAHGHIWTAVTEAAETAAGRTASVVAAAPVGITTHDADGDRRRGDGEAMARRRQGDGEATTRQRRGNKDEKAIGYGAAGGRDNKAIDKRITNNRT